MKNAIVLTGAGILIALTSAILTLQVVHLIDSKKSSVVAPSAQTASVPAIQVVPAAATITPKKPLASKEIPSSKPAPSSSQSPDPVAPINPVPVASPAVKRFGYRLLPGQITTLRNKDFTDILIQSHFPISVLSGNCHNKYTVQWHCKGDDLGDVIIQDVRPQPLISTPDANAVLVTVRQN
jgi:hypothetical protein